MSGFSDDELDGLEATAMAVQADFKKTHGRDLTREEYSLTFLTIAVVRGMLKAELHNLRDQLREELGS